MFFKLALLNILKHKKRSLLILFCVMLSVFVLVFLSAMMNGLKDNYFQEIIGNSGHIQIHAEGWSERLNPVSLDYLIEDTESLIKELEGYPGVADVQALTFLGTLLINGEENIGTLAVGLPSDTLFYQEVLEAVPEEARQLSSDDILVSESLAELLGMVNGQAVMLLCEDSMGSPIYREFTVKALFDTGKPDIDDQTVFLHPSAVEDLAFTYDQASEIRLLLDDPDQASYIVEEISSILEGRGIYGEDWATINGSLVVFVEMVDLIMIFMDLMIIVVIASVLTNAILMTVLKRSREYGTLRAIGLKRRQLFIMILTEGLTLGVVGSAAGLAVGFPVVGYFSRVGLNIGEMASFFGTSSTYFFSMNLYTTVTSFLSGVLVAAGGSLFAALIASKKGIMESLTTV